MPHLRSLQLASDRRSGERRYFSHFLKRDVSQESPRHFFCSIVDDSTDAQLNTELPHWPDTRAPAEFILTSG